MWQPIETAPRDDREIAILICNARVNHQRVAYYEGDVDPTYPWHVEDAAKGFNHHKDWPTHWQPLPAPPGHVDQPDVIPDRIAGSQDGLGNVGG